MAVCVCRLLCLMSHMVSPALHSCPAGFQRLLPQQMAPWLVSGCQPLPSALTFLSFLSAACGCPLWMFALLCLQASIQSTTQFQARIHATQARPDGFSPSAAATAALLKQQEQQAIAEQEQLLQQQAHLQQEQLQRRRQQQQLATAHMFEGDAAGSSGFAGGAAAVVTAMPLLGQQRQPYESWLQSRKQQQQQQEAKVQPPKHHQQQQEEEEDVVELLDDDDDDQVQADGDEDQVHEQVRACKWWCGCVYGWLCGCVCVWTGMQVCMRVFVCRCVAGVSVCVQVGTGVRQCTEGCWKGSVRPSIVDGWPGHRLVLAADNLRKALLHAAAGPGPLSQICCEVGLQGTHRRPYVLAGRLRCTTISMDLTWAVLLTVSVVVLCCASFHAVLCYALQDEYEASASTSSDDEEQEEEGADEAAAALEALGITVWMGEPGRL